MFQTLRLDNIRSLPHHRRIESGVMYTPPLRGTIGLFNKKEKNPLKCPHDATLPDHLIPSAP